jgi:hypothetical protein
MAQLTFPIVTGELRVDVRINLSAPTWRQFTPTASPRLRLFWHAPHSTPAVTPQGCLPRYCRQLPLAPTRQSNTQGIGGQVSVDLYRISLSICDAAQPHLPWFVQPDLLVMELPPGFWVDVLIGMDVLLNCRTLIDGPGRQFTLDF